MNMMEIRQRLMEEFSQAELEEVDRIIEQNRHRPGSLIPVLELVQGVTGYLPDPLQEWIALGLKVPPVRVFGVVTFYSFFSRKPKGRHQIKVCLGTACYVKGSYRIVEQLEKELGIKDGEVTRDRMFSLQTLRCVGACGLAPVMVIGDVTYGKVKVDGLSEILSEYRN
jgi:NADH:ubiquinone oxidoreductase subunit E